MTVYNHPMSIQGRRRRRRVDVVDARKNQRFWIRIMWWHRFLAVALILPVRAPDA